MASRFTNPTPQFLDADGNPIAGGKLYFYETGTSTAKTTWADKDKTITNANPVVISAGGYCPDIFLEGEYRVKLTTDLGATVWLKDNVNAENAIVYGYISGLETSVNATDPSHDIDIARGTCASYTSTGVTTSVAINLAESITKRSDASWSAGTGNGGTASGPAVDGWNYIFAVIAGGNADVMFEIYQTPVNGIASYGVTAYRLIGAFYTDGSGNIKKYYQVGDYFWFDAPVLDVNANTGTGSSTQLISVPGRSDDPPLRVEADITVKLTGEANNTCQATITDPGISGYAASTYYHISADSTAAGVTPSAVTNMRVMANSSGQVRWEVNRSGTSSFSLYTKGFTLKR